LSTVNCQLSPALKFSGAKIREFVRRSKPTGALIDQTAKIVDEKATSN